ncbi:hypothetical protein HDU96_009486 [Phlyctochytrium bullatum]|nr:hypothetical protein HDU96_009486 [Phlyctochytrium bullatum]
MDASRQEQSPNSTSTTSMSTSVRRRDLQGARQSSLARTLLPPTLCGDAENPFHLTISVPQQVDATMALLNVAAAWSGLVGEKEEAAALTSGSATGVPPPTKKRRMAGDGPNLHDAAASNDIEMELLKKKHDPLSTRCRRRVFEYRISEYQGPKRRCTISVCFEVIDVQAEISLVFGQELVQLDLHNLNVNIVVEIYKVLVKFLGSDFASTNAYANARRDAENPFHLTISVPQQVNATMAFLKVAAAAGSSGKKEPADREASASTLERTTSAPPPTKKRRVSGDTSKTVSSALALGMQAQTTEMFVKAVEDGDMAAVRLFLAAGASPAVKNIAGMPEIHSAVIKDHEDILAAMRDSSQAALNLKAGVAITDIHNEKWDDLTPLQVASVLGKERTAKVLLEKGADMEVRSPRQNTALDMAAISGHSAIGTASAEICRIILETDATGDDMKGEKGDTALHLAVEQIDLEVIGLLLSFGANVQIRNNAGKTALDLAREQNPVNLAMLTLFEKEANEFESKKRSIVEWQMRSFGAGVQVVAE